MIRYGLCAVTTVMVTSTEQREELLKQYAVPLKAIHHMGQR